MARGTGEIVGAEYDQAKADQLSASADDTQAIKLQPAYYRAYIDRGIVKYQRRDVDGAIADYSKALALAPDQPESQMARTNLARVYNDRSRDRQANDDTKGALADCKSSIAVLPNAIAFGFLGAYELDKNHLKEAADDLNKALELNPDDDTRKKVQDFLHRINVLEGK